jgi:RimJ/RimL family protein N-acetyltransferase
MVRLLHADVNKMISTNRLKLRLLSRSDIFSIHHLHSLPETDEFNTLGIPDSLEVTERVIENLLYEQSREFNPSFTFVIEGKESNQFIGLISLKPGKPKYKDAEIWFKLHLDFWGQGYATEAVNAILDFGFNDLNLHRIEAGCAVDNTASGRVLEKAGMKLEGTRRQALPLKTGWSDNFEYAILKTDIRATTME